MAGHNANDQLGHQKAVIEHPSRHVVEPHTDEGHRHHGLAHESATARAQAGGSTSSPVTNSLPPPVRKLSSSSWEFVQHSDAPPSLTTSAPSIATAVQNNEARESDEKYRDLTASTLSAFNKGNQLEMGAKPSMKAKKGTATRASNDSDEPMGAYAPGEGYRDPDISGAGAWADEISRTALDLADELDRF